VHTVTLTNAFYMGRYEVTQAQWQARMGSNPSHYQGANRPVAQVSWFSIQGFCSSTGMRLPTEAEWEYAYRAGTTTAYHAMPGYPNGTNDSNEAGLIAWVFYNTCAVDGCGTRDVGLKSANTFGLHDMAGNAWEWVNDWYDTYPSSAQTNPMGPVNGSSRVFRGGSWALDPLAVRSSSRESSGPGYTHYFLGFRVARTP
jgi:formylglycine-generating enzyme required for sulfatase activity